MSVEVYPAYKVLRLDGRLAERPNDYELVLVNTISKEIAYYVDVALLDSRIEGKQAIHPLVYRSTNAAHSIALEGFGSSILFDCLVPHHTVILADGNHWDGGQFVWASRVSKAIGYGRKTYFIESDGALRRLNSHSDHQALNNELWDEDSGEQINLAVISKAELSGKADRDLLMRQLAGRMTVVTDRLILAGQPTSR